TAISLEPEVVKQLLTEGLAEVKKAVAELTAGGNDSGHQIAAQILAGRKQTSIADDHDFMTLAELYRERHDWPMYLALLEALYQRHPESNPAHQSGKQAW